MSELSGVCCSGRPEGMEKLPDEPGEFSKIDPLSVSSDMRDSIQDDHGSHFEKLRDMYPEFAVHIKELNLSTKDAYTVAYTMTKRKEFKTAADRMIFYGNLLFFTQVVAAALVPVLIGLIGSFDFDDVNKFDNSIRIIAIVLSILGTVAKAGEDVYDFRRRGSLRLRLVSHMTELFFNFCSLSGPLFDEKWNSGEKEELTNMTVIPDLTGVPMPLLEKHLQNMKDEAIEKEKKKNVEVERNKHADLIPTYMNAFNKLLIECRQTETSIQGDGS